MNERTEKVANKATSGGVAQPPQPKSSTTPPSISSIPSFQRRFSRSNSLTGSLPGQLPRFYFPNGRPYSSQAVESQIRKIVAVFERFPSRTVTRKEIGGVLKLVGIPVYWKEPLFRAVATTTNCTGPRRQSGSRSNSVDLTNGKGVAGSTGGQFISCEQFTDYWRKSVPPTHPPTTDLSLSPLFPIG